jgi:acyl-CoA reductase-like NAD-dependent aldehyde dehydrogenase
MNHPIRRAGEEYRGFAGHTLLGFSPPRTNRHLKHIFPKTPMHRTRPPIPLPDRLKWLKRFRKGVAAAEPSLCELISRDTGKSRFDALTADILPLLAACKWCEKNAHSLLSPSEVGGTPWWLRGLKITRRREPLGHVAIIATWNYPVQLLGIQLIHALVGGNTVVVKPSERSPASQVALLKLAIDAGLPIGTLDWTPPTREAGEELLSRQRFDHIVFTGSTQVGRAIAAAAARTLTPATLELSGRDSAFVLADANPEKAAESIWGAVCMNSGQTCMGPRRALIHRSVYPRFIARLSTLARQTRAKPLIDESAARLCHELVVAAIRKGGKDAAGEPYGSPNSSGPPPEPLGRTWRPTAVIDCPASAPLVEGRHFGPALAVVPFDTLEQALSMHAACDQHLTASIFTASAASAHALVPRLGVTNITINDAIVPTAHPAVSIGGHGESGMGLSRGPLGLLSMTRPVYVSQSSWMAARTLRPPPRPIISIFSRVVRLCYGARALTPRPENHPYGN